METYSRVRIRRLRRRDLSTTLEWRNRDDVRKWFKHSGRLTFSDHLTWFERNRNSDTDLTFIVERLSDNQPVGQVAIYRIDLAKRKAEVGRFISAPEYAGQGYLKEGCAHLLRFAFNELALDEVMLEVFENNVRAISLYKRLRFSEIRVIDGLVHMRLSKASWEKTSPAVR